MRQKTITRQEILVQLRLALRAPKRPYSQSEPLLWKKLQAAMTDDRHGKVYAVKVESIVDLLGADSATVICFLAKAEQHGDLVRVSEGLFRLNMEEPEAQVLHGEPPSTV